MTAEAFYEAVLDNMEQIVIAFHAVTIMFAGVVLYTLFWGRKR